jgi:hypothetical protein
MAMFTKSTMASFTKPTKKIERKPDEDANVNGKTNAVLISTGIMSREAKPALPAPLLDETASSKDKTASSENFSANSNRNADALLVSTGTKPSERRLLATFVNKSAPSENISVSTDSLATASTTAPAAVATVESEAEKETDSEAKTTPKMPSVYEVAPFHFSNLTNAPVTESEDIPTTTNASVTIAPKKTNKINSEKNPAPTTPPVSETAPSEIPKD